MKQTPVLSLAAAIAACALSSCGDVSHHEGPDSGSLALFSEDIGRIHREMVLAREEAGLPRSSLPPEIEWMPDIDAAFAKAKREDKPVLISTSVRENGNPAGDV
jgi:hypothetical protein